LRLQREENNGVSNQYFNCLSRPTDHRTITDHLNCFFKSQKQLSEHHDRSHRIFSCVSCQFLVCNFSCFSFCPAFWLGKHRLSWTVIFIPCGTSITQAIPREQPIPCRKPRDRLGRTRIRINAIPSLGRRAPRQMLMRAHCVVPTTELAQ
jgi:hypothetical protein